MRVSAGFLVTGLSGKRRIQTLPPRFTKRVMATRLASIWRSLIQPGSRTLRPYCPNASSEPRQALPAMRPRCCLRYLTFFGINIKISSRSSALRRQLKRSRRYGGGLRLAFFLREDFAAIYPGFDADYAVSRTRFGEAVIDVRA